MTEAAGRATGEAPGPVTLALAYVWSELRGQGWKLFAVPFAVGGLGAAGILLATVSSPPFDPETERLLRTAAGQYFAGLPADNGLVLAFIVAQGPSIVTMVVALMGLLMVQNGLGKRLAGGEFELLLSGPYGERDVFLALVLGSFLLVLGGTVVVVVLTMGVGLGVLWSSGAQLNAAGQTLFAVGLLAPVPMGLWATFAAVVVYLVFPEAATNNSHPGNLLAMVAIFPALSVLLATTVGTGVDPFLVVLGANLVPAGGIAVGWVTVRRWFDVKRVL